MAMLLSISFPLLLACGRGDGVDEPVWGKQACAHCRMVLGDRRYAAEVLALDGTRSFFDDIGCMVAFIDERKVQVRHVWVRDEGADRWLDGERARFRRGARTPMDYGFAAGATGELDIEAVRHEVRAPGGKTP